MASTTITVGIIVLVMLVMAVLGWASVYFVGAALRVDSHDEADHEVGNGPNDGQSV